LTQDGHELTPTLCQSGNSTGGPNSPIGQLGWTDSYEYNPQNGYSGSGSVELVVDQNTWSLTNPDGYGKLGVSIKQGNGFAFFELDLNKALSGMWATGNDPYPTGTGLSHMNAWYMGDPVNQIPVPASLPLLLGALGIGGFLARRKPAKT
jgi:hypothetical protein